MSEESFVSRWSRLKRRPQTGRDGAAEETEQQALQAEPPRDIHQLTDSDMPPIESLDESSDYSVFLSEKVSESLRQAALRKMFHSPALNVVDGLDDYAEDFRHFEPLGDILTHDMRRLAERQAEPSRTQGAAGEGETDDAVAEGTVVADMEPGHGAEPGPGEGEVDDA